MHLSRIFLTIAFVHLRYEYTHYAVNYYITNYICNCSVLEDLLPMLLNSLSVFLLSCFPEFQLFTAPRSALSFALLFLSGFLNPVEEICGWPASGNR